MCALKFFLTGDDQEGEEGDSSSSGSEVRGVVRVWLEMGTH